MAEVFLDTVYAVALSIRQDSFHEKAVALSQNLEDSAKKLVTTHAVMFEIANALSDVRYRQSAVRLLETLETDANVEIVSFSQDLFDKSFSFTKIALTRLGV
jgi:uncharacterized protein